MRQGSKVHTFEDEGERFSQISEDSIAMKFKGLPDNIDSIFVWSKNKMVYATKGQY